MNRTRLVLALALLAPLGLHVTACSSDDSTSTTTPDGGTGDDGSSSQVDSGGGTDGGTSQDTGTDAPVTCNNVTQAGSAVPLYIVQAAAPTPVGGSLVDGTYVVTDARAYTGSGGDGGVQAIPGSTVQATIQLAGGTAQIVSTTSKGTSTETDTFVVSGTGLTLNETCPKTGSHMASFSSITGDAGQQEFLLFVTQNSLTLVETLVKQ